MLLLPLHNSSRVKIEHCPVVHWLLPLMEDPFQENRFFLSVFAGQWVVINYSNWFILFFGARLRLPLLPLGSWTHETTEVFVAKQLNAVELIRSAHAAFTMDRSSLTPPNLRADDKLCGQPQKRSVEAQCRFVLRKIHSVFQTWHHGETGQS